MSFAAGATQFPRGRAPNRVPAGGRWGQAGAQGLRRPPVFKRLVFKGQFLISGITRDSTGAVLASCDVHLVDTQTDIEVAQTISGGDGSYSFQRGSNSTPHYIVAYKVGSPDVAGTTRNDIYATIV